MEPGRSAHARFLEQRTFGSLDGIRCGSIVAVIFHHGPGGLELGNLTLRGFLGVDMFFVLSGFLIVTLLLRERERRGSFSLRAFYMRRTLRIMPLYYGVVLLYALLFGVLRTDGLNGRNLGHDLPYLLTYTANWVPIYGMLGVAWSLAAEEQFYLLWPPMQKAVRSARGAVVLLVGLILLSQLITFGVLDGFLSAAFGWAPNEPGMLRQTTFTPILMGVLIAYGMHHARTYEVLAKLLGRPWMSALWLALLVLCCQLLPDPLMPWSRLAVQLIMGALLIACVTQEDHVLAKPLRNPVVARIGMLCYGLYLWHMFALDGVDRLIDKGMPKVLQFPALMFVSWVIAELSYRFYEQPFLKLKHRFSR